LTQLEQKLGEAKQERDRAEGHLRERHLQQQQQSWQLQKLQETQSARREELATLEAQLQIQQAELPDPLPDVPVLVDPRFTPSESSGTEAIAFDSFAAQLEQLQKEIRNSQKTPPGNGTRKYAGARRI
jgi:chromosome segregation protein